MSLSWRRPTAAALFLFAFGTLAQDLTPTAGSPATADQWFEAGSESFARGDYASALSAFEAAIAAGSDGPAVHYNAAVSEYRLGEYAAAESRFRALGEDFPEMRSLADYNVGLALVRQNRLVEARAAFEMAALSGDDTVAQLAHAMLARLPDAAAGERRRRALGFFGLRAGHDDNVALIDPLGLPAGQSTESPFVELSFYFDAPLARTSYWRLATTAFSLEYPDAGQFDQTGLRLASRYERTLGEWLVAAGPAYGRTYVDGDGFEAYLSADIELRRRLSVGGTSFRAGLRFDSIDALAARYDYIDGSLREMWIAFDKPLGFADLGLSFRRRDDARESPRVSAERNHYAVTLRRRLSPLWIGDIGLEYRDSVYGRIDPVRQEERLSLRLRATRELTSRWRLTADYSHTDNDSTEAVFGYTRDRLALGADRSF